jgi:hypothetical protein
VKDPTFHRAVADKAVAIDLGRDLELAFLQGGPNIVGVVDIDDAHEQIKLEGLFSEVARIRVSVPTGLALVMNLLEQLVRADKVKADAMAEAIRSWAEDTGNKEVVS